MHCHKCQYLMQALDEACPKCNQQRVVFITPDPSTSPRYKRYLKWFLLSFAALVLIGFSRAVWFRVYTTTQRDEILKVLLLKKHQNSSSRVIYVAFNGKNPPDDIAERFKGAPFLVRKVSHGVKQQCGMFSDPICIVDKTSGEKGSYISIDRIGWIDPSQVQVEVSYLNLGHRLTLVKQARGWRITREELAWIA